MISSVMNDISILFNHFPNEIARKLNYIYHYIYLPQAVNLLRSASLSVKLVEKQGNVLIIVCTRIVVILLLTQTPTCVTGCVHIWAAPARSYYFYPRGLASLSSHYVSTLSPVSHFPLLFIYPSLQPCVLLSTQDLYSSPHYPFSRFQLDSVAFF